MAFNQVKKIKFLNESSRNRQDGGLRCTWFKVTMLFQLLLALMLTIALLKPSVATANSLASTDNQNNYNNIGKFVCLFTRFRAWPSVLIRKEAPITGDIALGGVQVRLI